MSTRRSSPCLVDLGNNQLHRIPTGRWRQWVAIGALVLVAHKVARPAWGGLVWLEDGVLKVADEPIAPWMNLNCRVMDQYLLQSDAGPRLTPEQLQREIQAQYA